MSDFKVTRTALIDGDFVAFQTAAWAHTAQAEVVDMTERLVAQLTDWVRRAFCQHVIVALSCPREDGFRREAYPLYKAHRNSDPPAMLGTAKDILRSEFKVVQMPGLEADDIMGIIATNGKVENPVIVTVDKDLLQVPGWHFNPEKQDFPVRITEQEANVTFLRQWLTGDNTDGFKGLDKVGPVKAAKIIPDGLDLESGIYRVVEAYSDAKQTHAYAEAMARCARILRAEDWDAAAKRPRLFTVPTFGPVQGVTT